MDAEHALDLIESTHNFPCKYLFKVVGWNRNDFVQRVLSATQEVVGRALLIQHSMRETKSGRHISISLEPYLDHSEQVLEVYGKIRELDDVIMYW